MRKTIKETRYQLSDAYIKQADKMIAEHITGLMEFKQAKTVFCFVSTRDEIDTFPVLNQIMCLGKRLAVPKCLGPGRMEAYEVSSSYQLEPGAYGILEPTEDCRQVGREEVDFAVVPCLTCDLMGRRLGYGGGYYDRYMKKRTYPAAVVCRERLLSDEVPAEEWDQIMDLIVTEKRAVRRL